MITYDQWRSNYKELENIKENYKTMDNLGVGKEMLNEDTKLVRIYKEGGYIEKLANNEWFVGIESFEYQSKNIDEVQRPLYEWANGECFN